MSSTEPAASSGEREFHLLDLFAVVLRRWRAIAGCTLAAGLLSLVAVMASPPVYVSRSVLVPYPEQSGGGLNLGGAAADLPGGLPQLLTGGGNQTVRLLDAVLKSGALRDTVARRVAPADTVRRREVRAVLSRGAKLAYDRLSNSVSVEIRAPEARMAQEIGAALPAAINDIAAVMRADGAAYRQRFLGQQLAAAREKLVSSEQRLLAFQNGRGGGPDLEEQSKQTLQAAAELQRAIGELEVRVAQLRRSVTPDNPTLRSAVAELGARRGQLARLTAGQAGNPVFVPLGESSQLRVAATRIAREYAADEQVYGALTAALAQSQIDANNRLPALAVLDAAYLPRSADRLRDLLTLASALIAGFIAGLVVAFLREHLSRGDRGEGEPLDLAWRDFKSDLGRYSRLGRR